MVPAVEVLTNAGVNGGSINIWNGVADDCTLLHAAQIARLPAVAADATAGAGSELRRVRVGNHRAVDLTAVRSSIPSIRANANT